MTLNKLHEICTALWETGIWPDKWTQSVFILLPKKAICYGATTAGPWNWSHMPARVILDTMQIKLESEIAQEQAGFRPRREHAIRLPTSGSFWRRQEKEIRQCASASLTS